MLRQTVIENLEAVIFYAESDQYDHALNVDPLKLFVDELRQHSSHLKPTLDEDESVANLMAMAIVFAEDSSHAALTLIFGAEQMHYFVLNACIDLLKANILTPQNLKQFLKFVSLELQKFPNHYFICFSIVTALAQNKLLSQNHFELIFNEKCYAYYDRKGTLLHAMLAHTCALLQGYIDVNDLKKLRTKHIIALNEFLVLVQSVLTPEIKQAIAKELTHAQSILNILIFNDQAILPPQCLPTVIKAAKYNNDMIGNVDLVTIIEIYYENGFFTEVDLLNLFHLVLASEGKVKGLIPFLVQPENPVIFQTNLLCSRNIAELPRLLPYAQSVHAALAVLDHEDALSQEIFDLIVSEPLDALYIAAVELGGMESLRDICKNAFLQECWPQAVATLNSFIDLATAERFFHGPIRRVLKHNSLTLFSFYPYEWLSLEMLPEITSKVITPGTLEPAMIAHIMACSRKRGRLKNTEIAMEVMVMSEETGPDTNQERAAPSI